MERLRTHKLRNMNIIRFSRSGPIVVLIVYIISVLITSHNVFAFHTPSEYPISSDKSMPAAITSAGGSLWYMNRIGYDNHFLSQMTTDGTVTDYSLLPSGYHSAFYTYDSLSTDSNGNVWVAGCAGTTALPTSRHLVLWKADPTTGTMTNYTITGEQCLGFSSGWSVQGSTIDANDNIWVAMQHTSGSGYAKILRFNTSATLISTYNPNSTSRNWSKLTAGPDGNLWAADYTNSRITKLEISPIDGNITGHVNYSISVSPSSIITGPDGNLWFGSGTNQLGKITPTGIVSYFTLTSGRIPERFTISPDGALWFTTRLPGSATEALGRATVGGTVTEYSIPTANANLHDVTIGPDGALWFTEFGANKIGRLSLDPYPSEYSISTGKSMPAAITSASDSLWYMNRIGYDKHYLSKMTVNGTVTDYSLLPSGYHSALYTYDSLNTDSNGNVWVAGCAGTTALSTSRHLVLWKGDTATGTMTSYLITSEQCLGFSSGWSVQGSTIDANDNIWVAMQYASANDYTKILRFNTSGALISTYNPNTIKRNWSDLTAGPDGNLWAADYTNSRITKLTTSPTTGNIVSSVNYSTSVRPSSITAGPDGNLWFASDTSTLGKITPAGTLTYYPLSSGRIPRRLASGPDGAMWFTTRLPGSTTEAIGHITTSGAATEYSIPTASASLFDIAIGPDGAMWFTEFGANKIGRLGY